MALDVIVKISQTAIAGKDGFGMPLILTTNLTDAVPYTLCETLEDVKNACGSESEAVKAADLIFAQKNKPSKIAVYGSKEAGTTAIAEVISKPWRQLIVIKGDSDETTDAAISAYIESTNKLFFITVSSIEELANLKDYSRTVAFYYDLKNGENLVQPYAVAALVGETAGRTVGSFTYKNIIIKGLVPLEISDNQLGEIHNGGALTVVTKAGDIVTTDGKVCSGEFIDIIDSKDWIIQQIEYRTQQMMNNSDKLPCTDTGISVLENATANVLQEAFTNGMIATAEDGTTPLYTVNFKKRSEMSAEERASRTYTGGNFEFTLAGAIHSAEIKGELII